MCGIVGLFLKTEALQPELGRLAELMLLEMRDRGPDSAGYAIYDQAGEKAKLTCMSKSGQTAWDDIVSRLSQETGHSHDLEVLEDHALLSTTSDGVASRNWLIDHAPDVTVLALGQSIELFKGIGDPENVAKRFGLATRSGTHAIGHTRFHLVEFFLRKCRLASDFTKQSNGCDQ